MAPKKPFPVPDWFTEIPASYNSRDEIIGGGVITQGASFALGAFHAGVTGISSFLRGYIAEAVAPLVDIDLLATAGSVGQPIFEDGADASALLIGAAETAYCTLLLTNSDGAGAADESDNCTPLLVLVVAGTAATYDAATTFLTSDELEAALGLSAAIHDGTTGWTIVGSFLVDGATTTMTVTMNRNNVLGV